uniref:Uncharacterized protein n=1 Tax=Glossina palpalis gambiensis TaxID=67801 RepID=A0A1B0BQJ7_9MUSC
MHILPVKNFMGVLRKSRDQQQAAAAICIGESPSSATNKSVKARCVLPRDFANSVDANTNECDCRMAIGWQIA